MLDARGWHPFLAREQPLSTYCLVRIKVKTDGIHAESFVGRGGTVVKYMPEVGIASPAENLGTAHSKGPVFLIPYTVLL